MTHDEKVKLIDDLYASTGIGDFDTAETMLTDDFFITEAEGLPMAGVYSGKRALRELYAHVMTIMDVAALQRDVVTSGGDYAVCILSFQFTDASLKPGELCEMFRFRDGKVCEIKPYYFDPATMVAAHQAKLKAAG